MVFSKRNEKEAGFFWAKKREKERVERKRSLILGRKQNKCSVQRFFRTVFGQN